MQVSCHTGTQQVAIVTDVRNITSEMLVYTVKVHFEKGSNFKLLPVFCVGISRIIGFC